MKELTGGGADRPEDKRLPGRDTGTLKTDSKKLKNSYSINYFYSKLGMHFKMSYIEFFGSKTTIFET